MPYIIHGEKEMNKGFADIIMEPFRSRYEGIQYSYILEIKCLKAGMKPGKKEASSVTFQKIIEEAETQLRRYGSDKKFKKSIEKIRLIKLVLIFLGHAAIHIGEVE